MRVVRPYDAILDQSTEYISYLQWTSPRFFPGPPSVVNLLFGHTRKTELVFYNCAIQIYPAMQRNNISWTDVVT